MNNDAAIMHYRRHGVLSDPGAHAARIAALPDDVPTLVDIVRGLLIHGDWLDLYGLTEADFPGTTRDTLPLAARLDAILAHDNTPIGQSRPPALRSVATCRDYALMLTAFLRCKHTPARVRCGFAAYFENGRLEDHWICEYWRADEARWAIADAQLDAEHRAHLSIDFDTADLPAGSFFTAAAAWRQYRQGKIAAEKFGHGTAAGAWFLYVNIARDYLALHKQETSLWDRWRDAPAERHALDADALRRGDALAVQIAAIEENKPAVVLSGAPQPFWLDPAA
ncbi:MAG: transglutaminase domain-containing protein [Dongiaceae bacterium]